MSEQLLFASPHPRKVACFAMMRLFTMLLVALALACEGEIEVPNLGDMPDMAAPVTDMPVGDMSEPDATMMPDPLCVGVICGANAECGRGQCWCSAGFMGDANAGCTPGNPCEAADCVFGATCRDTGECVCDIGFMDDQGTCVPIDEEFPEERTMAEVCERWNRDYPETAGPQWQTEPADQCSTGELDTAFQLDAVRRVTLYRWLAGLPGVTTLSEYATATQACATTLDAQNVGATRDITEDFACFSEAAADAAQQSSILRTARSPAEAVDTFIEDADAPTLGNRRWILNPEMGATAFGFRGDYTCMYATDNNGSTTRAFVAYPFSVFPVAALRGRWMWASNTLFTSAATTVTVMTADGTNVPITNVQRLEGLSFPAAMVWEVAGAAPGEYTVTLQGLAGAMNELTYSVNLVNCP